MQTNIGKTTWVSPELDFEELYRDGRYEDIIQVDRKSVV